jgi:hypothetical protein
LFSVLAGLAMNCCNLTDSWGIFENHGSIRVSIWGGPSVGIGLIRLFLVIFSMKIDSILLWSKYLRCSAKVVCSADLWLESLTFRARGGDACCSSAK